MYVSRHCVHGDASSCRRVWKTMPKENKDKLINPDIKYHIIRFLISFVPCKETAMMPKALHRHKKSTGESHL